MYVLRCKCEMGVCANLCHPNPFWFGAGTQPSTWNRGSPRRAGELFPERKEMEDNADSDTLKVTVQIMCLKRDLTSSFHISLGT